MAARTQTSYPYPSRSYVSSTATTADENRGIYFTVYATGTIIWGFEFYVPSMAEVTWEVAIYEPNVGTALVTHQFTTAATTAGWYTIELPEAKKITFTRAMVQATRAGGLDDQWCIAIRDTNATPASRQTVTWFGGPPNGRNYNQLLTGGAWAASYVRSTESYYASGSTKPTTTSSYSTPLSPIFRGGAEVSDNVGAVAGPDGTARVSTAGGEILTVEGQWPTMSTVRAYFGESGDETDTPCYFGYGYGYDGYSEDGAAVTIIAPPHPKSTTAKVTLVVDGTPLVSSAVEVIERAWPGKMHRIRASFAPWKALGARRLELEEAE